MSESKVQIVIPTSEEIRLHGLQKEIKSQKQTVQKEADETYYKSNLGPNLGKVVWTLIGGRNQRRVKAMETNPQFLEFMKAFYRYVELRAKEMGYAFEDVQLSKSSGITKNGLLLLKLEAKQNAKKLA